MQEENGALLNEGEPFCLPEYEADGAPAAEECIGKTDSQADESRHLMRDKSHIGPALASTEKGKVKTRSLAMIAISVSVALLLSYIEFLLPPLWSAVPGIKLGLANSIVIFLAYKTSPAKAGAVSLVRVILSSLLFGSVLSFAYSFAGAAFSLAVMLLLKKTDRFSTVGVSVAGAVMHNAAQIAVAAVVLRTREIGYYMAPLAISGIVAGIFVGLLSSMLIKKVKIKF